MLLVSYFDRTKHRSTFLLNLMYHQDVLNILLTFIIQLTDVVIDTIWNKKNLSKISVRCPEGIHFQSVSTI